MRCPEPLLTTLLFIPRLQTMKKNQREYSYTVIFEPAEEGGYVVTCPALPGLVTEGDTLEEAREMAKDAVRGYLESLRKDGLPIPSDRQPEELHKEEIRIALEVA
jgi:antitoxin HicB